MADTQLILHVEGTQDTTALPKTSVRSGIAEGRIRYSQLIWSPLHNAWKQVRELPHLWPSQKIAPAPPRHRSPTPAVAAPAAAASRPQPSLKPRVSGTPRVQGPPKVVASVRPKIAATPKVVPSPRVQATVQPRVERSTSDHVVLPPSLAAVWAKWVSLGIAGVLALSLALNYFAVDLPLVSRLHGTAYGKVHVLAHLGAFVQPDSLVIHVARASAVPADDFGGFLSALARSTPARPLTGGTYLRVALTSGWLGQYSFDGEAWSDLGRMAGQSEADRESFILSQLDDGSGRPVVSPEATPGERKSAWRSFVQSFTSS